ncbi:patatin-like protein 2 [Coffea arabica]|uniref:Patatin-like protein 2 n=1 Tax=Coffea arabica TaxID=13443 RepID=A0ABM4W1U7_COFAR
MSGPSLKTYSLFAAKEIKDFYLDDPCPKIFPQARVTFRVILIVFEKLVFEKFSNPTRDIKFIQPTIFSSYELKHHPSLDAFLGDTCKGTSAAPTYLPAHRFEVQDSDGCVRKFNLIDGGVAANNPALIAMNQVTKEVSRGNSDVFSMKPLEYNRIIVLSLGTGTTTAKGGGRYDADEAAKWGIVGWLTSDGSTPLVDVFTQASCDLVDFHLSTVFQALQSEDNYLRIQVAICDLGCVWIAFSMIFHEKITVTI